MDRTPTGIVAKNRRDRTHAAAAIVVALSFMVPLLTTAGASSPVPGLSTPHPVVTGGFALAPDGSCAGQMTVTTDRPLAKTENAVVIVRIDHCNVTSADIVGSALPRLAYPCEEGCEGHASEPQKPQEAVSNGHAEWDTEICEPDPGCFFHGSLVIDVYQEYYAADGDNLQSEGTGVNCQATGAYTMQECENFQGTTYGSQLSTLGKGHASKQQPYGSYDLYGYITLYTYFGGDHQAQCSFSGNTAGDTSQVACD